jgi:hypothetical protein
MSNTDHSQSPDHRPDFWEPNTGTLAARRRREHIADDALRQSEHSILHSVAIIAVFVLCLFGILFIGMLLSGQLH